jgi:hypothetical protein
MKVPLNVKIDSARFEKYPLTWDDWMAFEEGKSRAMLSVLSRVLQDEKGNYYEPAVAEQLLRKADFTADFIAELNKFAELVRESLVPPGSGGA